MRLKSIVIISFSLLFILLNFNLLLAELTSGPGDDTYEREADSTADRVMGRPVPAMQPNPADMNSIKTKGQNSKTSNTGTTRGASQSMGRPLGDGPGSPVMNSGKMFKPSILKKAGTKSAMPTALQQRQQIQQKLTELGFQVAGMVPTSSEKWQVTIQTFDESKATPAMRGSITGSTSGFSKAGVAKLSSANVMDDGEHGDATLQVGFTGSGQLVIGAAGLNSAGLKTNAGKLQANGIIVQ